MKANKKGISLIVLVITIIVIIILAAAIILTMNNNNPIANAKTAVTANDKAEAQSAVTTYLGTLMAEYKDAVTINGDFGKDAASSTVTATYGTESKAITFSAKPTLETIGLGDSGLSKVTVVNNKVTAVAYAK